MKSKIRKRLPRRALTAAAVTLTAATLFLALPKLGDLSTAAGERRARREWEAGSREAEIRRCGDRLTIELCRRLEASAPGYDVSTGIEIEQQFWRRHKVIRLFNGSGYAPSFVVLSISDVGDIRTISRGYNEVGATQEGVDNFNAVSREEHLAVTTSNVRPYIAFYLRATVSIFNLKALKPATRDVRVLRDGNTFAVAFEYFGSTLRVAVKSDGTIQSSNIGAS